MKEFFEGVFEDFKSRYKNKFIGAFFLIYVGLNWERFIALFYASSMSYEELIEILAIDTSLFICLLLKAAVYAAFYLIISPWISLGILKIQSKAVKDYRIKIISDEIEVLNKKKSLEEVKKEVISLERENADENVIVHDNNKIIFDKLRKILPEKRLIHIYDNIESDRYEYEDINILNDFYNESIVLENEFDNVELKRLSSESLMKIKLLLDGLKQIKKIEDRIDSASVASLKLLNKSAKENKSETLDLYRKFLRAGFEFN